MSKEYRVEMYDGRAFRADNIKDMLDILVHISFRQGNLRIAAVKERDADGTLGGDWLHSTMCAKLTVPMHHYQVNADTLFIIDGIVITGCSAAEKFVIEQGFTCKEAKEILCSI